MPAIISDNLQDPPAADAAVVKARAVSGVKILAARTLASVLLRVVSSLVLARLLFPRDYGVFGVAAYLTGLGLFLSDAGLGGALIRQAEKPTADETFTVFWTQQAVTAILVLCVVAGSPWLVQVYHLSPAAALLLSVMALGLFLNSLRVVPLMALEREMQYAAIARCELIENMVQTAGTIALAALGCGAWALAGGGLLRGVAGLTCIWTASPWRPAGKFEWRIVRRLARFGIAFQMNALAPAVLGGWMPLAVSRLLGAAAVGLVGWAGNIASVPLMLSGVLNRIAFPAYSRLQSDPELLAGYLRASIRRLNVVLCLVVPVLVILCPAAVPAVFGPRWNKAVGLVQWFSLEIVLLSLNGLLCAAQNAAGYAADRLWVALGIGAVRAGAGWGALSLFGLAGLGPAVCLVSVMELGISAAFVVFRYPSTRLIVGEIFRPLLASALALCVAEGAAQLLLAKHLLVIQVLAALVLFAALTVIQEVLGRSRAILTELRGVARMLRPAPQGGH